MTHDDLLEHINKDIDQGGFVSACGEWFPARSLQALRAVVELHKPMADWRKKPLEYDVCAWCGWENKYPCETIQAIEKELR